MKRKKSKVAHQTGTDVPRRFDLKEAMDQIRSAERSDRDFMEEARNNKTMMEGMLLTQMMVFRQRISELKAEAMRGESGAIDFLYSIGMDAALALQQLLESQPEMLRAFARSKEFWPVYGGPYELVKEMHNLLFEDLQLGKNVTSSIPASKAFWTATEARIGVLFTVGDIKKIKRDYSFHEAKLRLISEVGPVGGELFMNAVCNEIDPFDDPNAITPLVRACIDLPDLGPETEGEWFTVIKAILNEQFDCHIEKETFFRPLGRHRDPSNSGSCESSIRAAIFDKLKQALHSMVTQTKID